MNALFQILQMLESEGISPQLRNNTACYMAFYMILIGPASECGQVRDKEFLEKEHKES